LLALGLKKETADMEIHSFKDDEQEIFETGYANKGYMEPEFAEIVDCFPAWSLHRLIELSSMGIIDTSTDDIYDKVIHYIEFLIKCGDFNKEYLEEL
jgi:hypothetical protein